MWGNCYQSCPVPKILVAKSCVQQYAFAQCLLSKQQLPTSAMSCFDLKGYYLGLLQEKVEIQTPVLLILCHQRTAFFTKRQQLLSLLTRLTRHSHEFFNLHRKVSRGITAIVGKGGYTNKGQATRALLAALATQEEMWKSVVALWAGTSGN